MSSIFLPAAIIPISNHNYQKSSNTIQFKCTEKNCPYGPSGLKFFKKEIFLQNHMKNIHGEKKFQCSKCEQKFGLEFQIKYHEKYCGQQLCCATCHRLPDDESFKFRKPKSESSTECTNCSKGTNFILIPMMATTIIPETTCDISIVNDDHNNLNKSHNNGNKFILPKNTAGDSKQTQTLMNNNTDKIILKNDSNDRIGKRSTECQTIRKRHRRHSRPIESNSIQTQTMYSSFDLPSVMINHSDHDAAGSRNDEKDCQRRKIFPLKNFDSPTTNMNVKSTHHSTFTQTLFDEEMENDSTSIIQHHDDPFMIKSSIIIEDDEDRQQQQQSTHRNNNHDDNLDVETNNHRSLYQNIETQTKEDDNDDCSWDHHHHHDDDLRFKEFFEFVDIETQTIWNYDQTTQTDHHHHSDDWSVFLN
ncbi:uncharacterized protein LOC142597856 isoform X2 [Dermatophagoides farinae]|uniref:uncharacterized protein LOC142597856 isoform X2 n=1 Tax=Dermatophagoides farinae TaxID=6954 RepID=UPI003F5E74B5